MKLIYYNISNNVEHLKKDLKESIYLIREYNKFQSFEILIIINEIHINKTYYFRINYKSYPNDLFILGCFINLASFCKSHNIQDIKPYKINCYIEE